MAAHAADPIDLSAQAFWQQPRAAREEAFAELRRERPVSWHGPPESLLVPPEEGTGGYWAITRHEDVRAVSRNPQTFCSGKGVMFDDAPPEMLEASQSFLAMDAPRHTAVRGLVNAAFTPRQVRRIEDRIQAIATELVDRVLEARSGDFVADVAAQLPMRTISDLMGVPEADRERVTDAANQLVGWNDPEVVGDRHPAELLLHGVVTLTQAALELAEARRAAPADDLMTALAQAEVDGQRLTDAEIGAFFVLLAVAGNDTTRHTSSHALHAFTEHPDQRAPFLDDPQTGVEELVRWASPVMTFRRTATNDAQLGDVAIGEGEKVVLFYTSANRDEAAFEDPYRFDVRRSPNHHVGFGGGGPHYCLGASLARTQLRALLGELLERAPTIQAGEPERLVGNFIDGIKRMPYAL